MKRFTRMVLGASALAALVSFGSPAGAQNEPYQHVPLPKDLPKGVSVADAQRVQDLIDAYRRQNPLKVELIRDNVYWAKGGPGGNDANVGFVVGKTGVIFIDSKNSAESEKDVVAEIAKITPKPVKTVILLPGDHRRESRALPAGVTVIAQENAKKEMENADSGCRRPPDYFPRRRSTKTKP